MSEKLRNPYRNDFKDRVVLKKAQLIDNRIVNLISAPYINYRNLHCVEVAIKAQLGDNFIYICCDFEDEEIVVEEVIEEVQFYFLEFDKNLKGNYKFDFIQKQIINKIFYDKKKYYFFSNSGLDIFTDKLCKRYKNLNKFLDDFENLDLEDFFKSNAELELE